jgi:hypothetical protein
VLVCCDKLEDHDINLAGRVVISGHAHGPGHIRAVGTTPEANFMLSDGQKPFLHFVVNKASLGLGRETPQEFVDRRLRAGDNEHVNISCQVTDVSLHLVRGVVASPLTSI